MRSASPGSQHSGVAGSEYADGLAKEAAEGSLPYNILDEVRRQVSLSHLHRKATE